jgi:putative transposase
VVTYSENSIPIGFSVKPSIHLDEWIGQLKGASSYEMGKDLHWQAGYGIVSFGTKDLDWVVAHIRNQKEHHAKRTTFDRLERTEDESP